MKPDQQNDPSMVELNHATRDVKIAILLVIITSIVQLLIGGLNSWNGYKDRKVTLESQKQHIAYLILDKQYDRMESRYNKIEFAIVNIRASFEQIDAICKKSNKLNNDDLRKISYLNQEVEKNKIAVVSITSSSRVILGDKIFNDITNFIADVEKVQFSKNPCSSSVSSSIIWRERATKINQEMDNSLARMESRIENILKNF